MKSVVRDPNDGRYVVGVDFGTTFTSIAFAHSSSSEAVKLVNTWPSGLSTGKSSHTVPTEVHYTRLHPAPREFQWGHGIPAPGKNRPEPLKWFKLLLQDTGATPTNTRIDTPATVASFFRDFSLDEPFSSGTLGRYKNVKPNPASRTSAELRRLGIQPATVVADFLSSVRKVAVECLENTYVRQFVAASKIEYVITVPAIWTDAAKSAMVKACEIAGYGKHRVDFHLVTEPEAAAAHTLKVIQAHKLKENDTFIICDAGGGTVDLIAYKVRTLEPLVLDEVVTGSGDLCGSVYLDNRFMAYMENLLGEQVMGKMKPPARYKMEMEWREQVKVRFAPSESSADLDYDVAVPGVPDDEEKDIELGYHTMKHENVKEIFDPIVSRIVNLVDQQVRAVEERKHTVAAVLLVGGFGSSPYLFHSLKEARYGSQAKILQVIQPTDADTAVVRGALLRGLDGSYVVDKRARRFYGISLDTPAVLNPGKGANHTYICPITGIPMIDGRMEWYVKKNELFDENHSHMIEAQTYHAHGASSMTTEIDLFATDNDEAPEFEWEKGGNVYKVASLSADLSKIPKATLTTIGGVLCNRLFYRIAVTIKMTNVGDVLKFELIHKGITYGEMSTKAE